jgi:DNA-binding IscR family transcriptional regulator
VGEAIPRAIGAAIQAADAAAAERLSAITVADLLQATQAQAVAPAA